MDIKEYVNIKTSKKARHLLRLLAALRGKSMQETAEDVFIAELEKEQVAEKTDSINLINKEINENDNETKE